MLPLLAVLGSQLPAALSPKSQSHLISFLSGISLRKEYPTLTHHRIPFLPLEHPPRSHISRSPLVSSFPLPSGTQHPPHIASNSSFNSKLSNYELCLYSNSLYRTGSSPLLYSSNFLSSFYPRTSFRIPHSPSPPCPPYFISHSYF